jgi:hypothetical protein
VVIFFLTAIPNRGILSEDSKRISHDSAALVRNLHLALTILTMLCWGSWANVLKIAKGWRFELLYYDYSIGVALGAAAGWADLRHVGVGRPPLCGRSGARGRHLIFSAASRAG